MQKNLKSYSLGESYPHDDANDFLATARPYVSECPAWT